MKDLGKAKTIIGWEIIKDIEAGTLKSDQKRYIRDLLEAKGITSYHLNVLHIKAGLFISMDQAGNENSDDLAAYKRLIRKLMNLAFGTWPDILFVVGLLSQYNFDPRVGHFRVAKQVLPHLKGMINLGIV